MYKYIAKHILAPSLDMLRGTRAMSLLRELEKSQWWSRDKILELQDQRLRMLIQYAWEKVPYYRHLFDDSGLRPGDILHGDDLVKLPILTKQLIRDNYNEITAQSFPSDNRVQLATGGSTGQPLVFFTTWQDHKDLCIASRQRASSAVGFELGDKSVSIRNTYPYETGADRLWQTPIRMFQRTLPLDVKEMTTEGALKIEAFRPTFITGYPSAIEQLARIIEAMEITDLRPKAIITGAEQLYDHQRDLFRKIFGCDTYDFYGSREEHLIAFECNKHSGYHIASENVIVEIVDALGKPVPAGSEGRILITNLHNYAMPFIRYDIGDMGITSAKDCPCGRGLPLLAGISGRVLDMISTKSRGKISGMGLYQPFRSFAAEGIVQGQIVQETPDKLVIKLVPGTRGLQRDFAEIKVRIAEEYSAIVGEDMDIIVELVDHIATTPDGKTRFVISNLASERE